MSQFYKNKQDRRRQGFVLIVLLLSSFIVSIGLGISVSLIPSIRSAEQIRLNFHNPVRPYFLPFFEQEQKHEAFSPIFREFDHELYEELLYCSAVKENEKAFVAFLSDALSAQSLTGNAKNNFDDMLKRFSKGKKQEFLRKTMSYIAPRDTGDKWLIIPSLPLLLKEHQPVFPFLLDVYIGSDEDNAEKLWQSLRGAQQAISRADSFGMFPKTIF